MTTAAQDLKLQELAAFVKTIDWCHTAILFGSRAQGTPQPDSDYDLMLVREGEGEVEQFYATWCDVQVDVSVYGESALEPEDLFRIRNGIVLRDEKKFGEQLIEQVKESFAHRPLPLPPDVALSKRVWVRKMLQRIARRDQSPVLADYWRVSLLHELLRIYFDLRGHWFEAPKESLDWLSENDRDAYENFAAALRPGASFEAIERLAQLVAGEEESRKS